MNIPISRLFPVRLSLRLPPKSPLTKLLCLLFIISCITTPQSTLAHPHSWVDMKTVIQGDKQHISGFQMSWTFDAMTSAYMLDGEDLSAVNKSATLQKIARSIMKNMGNEHYFTYFYDGDDPIKYAFSKRGVLTQNKNKLTLDFNLALAAPQEINGKSLKLLIFEPSYYVDMSWQKKADIQLSPELDKRCLLKLVPPDPTTENINYAMSLPANSESDNALGQLFTQTVIITCSAEKE